MKTEQRRRLSLEDHCTWRIGCTTENAYFPETVQALVECVTSLNGSSQPFTVIGRGSNILFSSEGIEETLVFTTGLKSLSLFEEHATAQELFSCLATPQDDAAHSVYCEAGVANAGLLAFSLEHSLGDVTALTGVPGTFGGAVAMNAESILNVMGERMWFATVNRAGGETEIRHALDFDFGYRHCAVQQTILAAVLLHMQPADSARMRAFVANRKAARMRSQPLEWPSAGCVFKNPEGDSAGALLDQIGMKGRRIGGAEYSHKHANFIINTGDATSSDVLELMALGKRAVWDRFHVCLTPEIKFIGRFDLELLEYVKCESLEGQ